MRSLHIVQGGVSNGDKLELERAAQKSRTARIWIVPKSVRVGDEVVIYITGFGFFATAKITSPAKFREDWPNRYGASLGAIRLIKPAISLGIIRRSIPELTWANYPRSITTPAAKVAAQVLKLIARRRAVGVSDLDDETMGEANCDELRVAALLKSRSKAPRKERVVIERIRSNAIRLYVLFRAHGVCEGCRMRGPFQTPDGRFYLEPHHTHRLADDGPDHPAKVIALCPNCHRRAHHAKDAIRFNESLKRRLLKLERG